MTVDLLLSQTYLHQLWQKHWPDKTGFVHNSASAFHQYESLFLSLCRDGRIYPLVARLQSMGPETYHHSLDVFLLGNVLADYLQMEMAELAAGFLLHDVGKTYISSYILQKSGTLTPEEWETVQEHPMRGYHLLRAHGLEDSIAHMALYHHERGNQTGYPFGLPAWELPAPLRLLSVVDVYSALTLPRSYRKALTPDQALYHLRKHTEELDAVYIHALLNILHTHEPDPGNPSS